MYEDVHHRIGFQFAFDPERLFQTGTPDLPPELADRLGIHSD